MLQRVVQDRQQAGVLGVVIGADAEEFAQFGQRLAVRAGQDGSKASRAGVSAGSAVAVGRDPAGFSGGWAAGVSAKRLGAVERWDMG